MEKIPEGAVIAIEEEYKKQVIKNRGRKLDIPMTQANQWKGGAYWGYSLSQTEIESLRKENERLQNLLELSEMKSPDLIYKIAELQSEVERLKRPKVFDCRFCDSSFSDETDLDVHVNRNHNMFTHNH